MKTIQLNLGDNSYPMGVPLHAAAFALIVDEAKGLAQVMFRFRTTKETNREAFFSARKKYKLDWKPTFIFSNTYEPGGVDSDREDALYRSIGLVRDKQGGWSPSEKALERYFMAMSTPFGTAAALPEGTARVDMDAIRTVSQVLPAGAKSN